MDTQTTPNVVDASDQDALVVQRRFVTFLEEFTTTPGETPEYVQRLEPLRLADLTTLSIDFGHLTSSDHILADAIIQHYYRFATYLNRGVQNFVRHHHPDYVAEERGKEREFFASFFNLPMVDKVRDLRTAKVGRLCSVSGTVTRTSEVRPELLYGAFECFSCNTIQLVEQQFKYSQPVRCNAVDCKNVKAFSLVHEESRFVDWQKVRIQENANEVPPGSMPRSLEVILRHEIVDKAKPGDNCVFTGSLIVIPDISQLRGAGDSARMRSSRGRKRNDDMGEGVGGLKALGVRDLTYRIAFLACAVTYPNGSDHEEETKEDIQSKYTDAEKHELMLMAQQPNLIARMRKSIAPTVFGHEDIKLGILLMLFGGVHKSTQEKTKLRGDVNICIVGDPSTAKSQFLKYVCSFLPRAIYTSGKASSASGLTASVVRDSETGEFCIEAGALMLADNGVCCIDEFDKMDDVDQVAIHEAMEQQTISITKAGIQATLNARTSVLAAANPIHGRYDRSKTLKANVQLSPAIMSRFDLFFVVLDECDPTMDRAIAEHIVNVHQRRIASLLQEQDPEDALGEDVARAGYFTMNQLQSYIKFARTFDPAIPTECVPLFVEYYRKLRQGDAVGHNRTAYRITVRQLEALIRLSEALARMHLDSVVRPKYIEWAFRLLRTSIVQVDSADITFDDIADGEDEVNDGIGTALQGGDEGANMDVDPTQVEASLNTTQDLLGEGGTQLQQGSYEDQENNGASMNTTGGAEAAKKKKKKGKIKMSYDEYVKIANMIALRLRDVEEDVVAEGGSFNGATQVEVVQWYLEQKEDINSEGELIRARKTINQIIKRLIEKDSVLMEVADGESATASLSQEDREEMDAANVPMEERRTIVVHPNFVPGSDIGRRKATRAPRR